MGDEPRTLGEQLARNLGVCWRCKGERVVYDHDHPGRNTYIDCPDCDGTGVETTK